MDIDISTPATIIRLSPSVVNRIAAGEVIQRPSNAIKELLENSLDAKSTKISLQIKDGGLRLIQLQDNGSGIQRADLPLVCERFATSKLKTYNDLESISTYGFRGEALASISHVAHVSITTKTRDSPCAWRAYYRDGELTAPKPGGSIDPKACAGNDGTQIVVEDLFYNVDSRRNALKNYSDEYGRVLDVMQRYAVHNSHVAFTCKKQGPGSPDLQTQSSESPKTSIRAIYGAPVAKELLEFSLTDEVLSFTASGFVSNANYSAKKFVFLLFINNRLVDSSALKRQIENVYGAYLPKGSRPFVYLALNLKKDTVDVNVHPTKREVHFLNQDKIIQSVCGALETTMSEANQSRVFRVAQPVVQFLPMDVGDRVSSQTTEDPPQPGPNLGSQPVQRPTLSRDFEKFRADSSQQSQRKPVKTHVSRLVREDHRTQTLDAFLVPIRSSSASPQVQTQTTPQKRKVIDDQSHASTTPHTDTDDDADNNDLSQISQDDIPFTNREFQDVKLQSVLNLRKNLASTGSSTLSRLISEHIWVGLVDDDRALVQYATGLYMLNYKTLSLHFFHHQFLSTFANFGIASLTPPIRIYDLVTAGLECTQQAIRAEDPGTMMTDHEIASEVEQGFVGRRDMLREYFSVCVGADGMLTGLPYVLKGYSPALSKLPAFLLRVHSEVEWTVEESCFEGLINELALLYAVENEGGGDGDAVAGEGGEYADTIKNTLFPAFKRAGFVVPACCHGSFVKIVDLPDLYKVFERC